MTVDIVERGLERLICTDAARAAARNTTAFYTGESVDPA